MSKVARANCERGVSTLELTLAMPVVVFAILFLIGMGHALISKQHALVGGQFAAHYQRVRESAPNAATARRAASAGAETFRLSGGGSDTLSYTAKATPRKGLIAQLYRLKAANSQYQTPNITNACVPHCKPFDGFAKILSPEMITGIIFSGNGGGLSKDDLLSIVSGKGKKQRRQKPPGAVAVGPAPKGAGNSNPGKGGPPPVAGGGGKPPMNPPGGGTKTGGTDDDNGNGGDGNGNKSNGNGNGNGNGRQPGKNNNGNNGNVTPVPVPRPTPRPTPTPRPSPSPTPRPSPTPSPTPRPRTPREEASQRGAELVKQYKAEGVGQQAGRSGGHGDAYKRAGAKLVEEANQFPKNDPRREAYKIEGNRLIQRGKGTSHRGGGRGSR
jgi:hypothetical protein